MAEDSLEAMTEGKMPEEAGLRPVGKNLEEREGKMPEEAGLRPVGKNLEEREEKMQRVKKLGEEPLEGKMQRVAEPGTKQLAEERE
jgi:hypothetical protein